MPVNVTCKAKSALSDNICDFPEVTIIEDFIGSM